MFLLAEFMFVWQPYAWSGYKTTGSGVQFSSWCPRGEVKFKACGQKPQLSADGRTGKVKVED